MTITTRPSSPLETMRRRPLAMLAAAGLAGTAIAASATAVVAAEDGAPAPIVIDFESADTSGVNGVEAVAADDALPAAAGCFYGAAPVTNYSTHGSDGFVNTAYAGYSSVYPEGGYTASADFYLAAEAEQGQFSWSHGVNGTDGVHQRDFIFHVASTGSGAWSIGASYSATTTDPYVTSYPVEPLTISTEGWYTFQHTIRDQDGLLYVDLTVLDDAGASLAEWTLGGQEADVIADAVGGNRYGWLVNNPFAGLPIDNVLLDSARPPGGCGPETTPEPTPEPEAPVEEGEPAAEQIDLGDAEVTFEATLGDHPSGELVLSSEYTEDPATIGDLPSDAQFSFGAFAYELNVAEASTATVTIETETPANTLFKFIDGEWSEYPAEFDGTTITFELTDGGAGDLDGEVNGVIVDPVAPALVATFTG